MKKNTLLVLIISVFIHLLFGNQIETFAESALFSEMAISQARNVQSKHEDSLMNQQGVRGVGIGQKDGRLGILVLLDKQANESQIPAQVDGLPVIIHKVGRIVAHKMNLGVSGGNDILCSGWCGTGTVGFKVCDNIVSGGGWITNNHVAAAGCPGLCPNNAPLGTDMFSPGIGDNIPVCTTTGAINVGSLRRFVPLILDSTSLNLVDAALVQSSDELVSDNIQGLGLQNNEIADPFLGQIVCKSGRTTGVTCGTITGINTTISVEYGDSCGTGKFINQVMYLPSPPYTSMSGSGDSGSPVVDSNNKAVALNFAGGDAGDGYGSPIRTVLQELQVSLCSTINGASVAPSGGTIGTNFTITGSGFGTKKSFVYLEYEKNGVIKQAKPKVTSWTDTSITGIWNITLSAGSYKMYVKPKAKGTSAIDVGTFIIKNPTIDEIAPNSCSIGAQNTIYGKFFSSIKPKVYFQNTTTLKKYSCKVTSFWMNPETGESSLNFSVPKVTDLASGDYQLILQNKIGQATADVCTIPNLTPYQPSGWSDKIVVSKVTGTTTDSSPLYTTDTLYVDWAVLNNGTAATSVAFSTDLYLDGTKIQSWSADSLNPNYIAYVNDYSIGPLSAGTHTLRIVTDPTDAINESNESDNEYTKTISVIAPPPPQGWTLTVVNNYSLSINWLYISSSSSSDWGSNWLSSPIPPGSSRTIPNILPGTYDIKAVVSDGGHAEWWDLTMGAGQTAIFTLH